MESAEQNLSMICFALRLWKINVLTESFPLYRSGRRETNSVLIALQRVGACSFLNWTIVLERTFLPKIKQNLIIIDRRFQSVYLFQDGQKAQPKILQPKLLWSTWLKRNSLWRRSLKMRTKWRWILNQAIRIRALCRGPISPHSLCSSCFQPGVKIRLWSTKSQYVVCCFLLIWI